MITSYHHVEINGVKYRLAEDAEGDHYRQNRQPLRLQTGAVVQGVENKFQLRQDLLEWQLTDWSGGEGQLSFDSEDANRYFEGHNIDPFDEPGKLKLARGFEETTDELDATLTDTLQVAKGRGNLWGASPTVNELREWDNTNGRWGSAVVNGEAGFAGGAWHGKGILGDELKLYLKELDQFAIWTYDGSSFVEHSTDFGVSTGDGSLAQLAGNIYILDPGGFDEGVKEISKSATPPVTSTFILDLSESGIDGNGNQNILASGNNRVYAVQRNHDRSIIWRITPSTAASVGFGEEILRQEGLAIDSVWFHMGVLFMAGRVGTVGNERTQVILYLRGSEVGVLANLRPNIDTAGRIVATEAQEFETAYFLAQYGPGDGTYEWTLFEADLISGAVAGTTVIDLQDTANQPQMLVSHNGEQFFGTTNDDASTYARTIRVLNDGTRVDTSTVTARLDSAVHDFGVVDEKILLSIRLMTEPLPTNSSVEIQYQLNQDGVWTSAGTYSADSGTGTTFTISSSGDVKTFRNLQLRLILDNGGTTTDTPVILSVSTRATVSAGLKLWDLLLDVADDEGEAGGERTSGSDKIANVETVGDADTVVEFKDGYQNREVGQFESFDVVMDEYSIDLNRPQEGTAFVRLRQVS